MHDRNSLRWGSNDRTSDRSNFIHIYDINANEPFIIPRYGNKLTLESLKIPRDLDLNTSSYITLDLGGRNKLHMYFDILLRICHITHELNYTHIRFPKNLFTKSVDGIPVASIAYSDIVVCIHCVEKVKSTFILEVKWKSDCCMAPKLPSKEAIEKTEFIPMMTMSDTVYDCSVSQEITIRYYLGHVYGLFLLTLGIPRFVEIYDENPIPWLRLGKDNILNYVVRRTKIFKPNEMKEIRQMFRQKGMDESITRRVFRYVVTTQYLFWIPFECTMIEGWNSNKLSNPSINSSKIKIDVCEGKVYPVSDCLMAISQGTVGIVSHKYYYKSNTF